MAHWETTVAITIGQGCSFAVQELKGTTPMKLKPNLVVLDSGNVPVIALGKFTKARIEELQSYLERLKIHAE